MAGENFWLQKILQVEEAYTQFGNWRKFSKSEKRYLYKKFGVEKNLCKSKKRTQNMVFFVSSPNAAASQESRQLSKTVRPR